MKSNSLYVQILGNNFFFFLQCSDGFDGFLLILQLLKLTKMVKSIKVIMKFHNLVRCQIQID